MPKYQTISQTIKFSIELVDQIKYDNIILYQVLINGDNESESTKLYRKQSNFKLKFHALFMGLFNS